MPTRDELKAIIDRLPYEKLDLAGLNLESILHPPVSNPRIEQFRRRSEEFQKQLPERLKQLQAQSDPSVIRGFAWLGGPGAWVRSGEKRTVNMPTPGERIVRT